MNRRDFLRYGAALAVAGLGTPSCAGRLAPGRGGEEGAIMTVLGPIAPGAMGVTLPHEHVMSTFGADITPHPEYDYEYDELANAALLVLRRLRDLGVDTLVDPTAAYFGRSPLALRRLSDASGLQIVTNTGYYGAADDRYVPEHARRETAEQLAARWVAEWERGIGDTGIRPGFIKVGMDSGPLSPIDAKLVRAAAQTHRASGLTIAAHTGNNAPAAHEQLSILREEGVEPGAWIWVHAHNVQDVTELARAAEQGAWISLDGLRPNTVERHLELTREMRRLGFLDQVLLSHDGNTYRPGGGTPRPMDVLFTTLIPALERAGFGPGEIRQLTVDNPRRAFTVRVRSGTP